MRLPSKFSPFRWWVGFFYLLTFTWVTVLVLGEADELVWWQFLLAITVAATVGEWIISSVLEEGEK